VREIMHWVGRGRVLIERSRRRGKGQVER